MGHYIIVTDNSCVKKVLKLMGRFESEGKVRVHAIAIYVYARDPRVLGGIKRINKEHVILLKGVFVPSLKD